MVLLYPVIKISVPMSCSTEKHLVILEACILFREIVVTKGPTNISTKLDLWRRVCMFLRYSEDHTQNVYRVLDLNMKKVVYSQDVQWMDIMYGEHMGIKHKIPIN